MRKLRFGSMNQIPAKAVFRKTNIQIWFILILAVIVVPAVIMMEKDNQKYVLSIKLLWLLFLLLEPL